MDVVNLPIGNLTGVFETRLLRDIQKSTKAHHKIVKGMRQERDFDKIKTYTETCVIGQNGPAYGFELYLDNVVAYVSPPVWKKPEEVGPAVSKWVAYVKQLPKF